MDAPSSQIGLGQVEESGLNCSDIKEMRLKEQKVKSVRRQFNSIRPPKG